MIATGPKGSVLRAFRTKRSAELFAGEVRKVAEADGKSGPAMSAIVRAGRFGRFHRVEIPANCRVHILTGGRFTWIVYALPNEFPFQEVGK